MKIHFLGTRGNIIAKTKQHLRHTVTVISYRRTRVAIDCGLDWLGHIDTIHPDAFVITHAHNDHIDGLQNGSPCPVYATQATWDYLKNFPLKEGVVIEHHKPFTIGSLTFEAFFVEHSFWAFAVGYRITAGSTTIFCVHDLISIKNRSAALKDVQLYIGDGASFNRPIIRYHDDQPFGHTTIMEQIAWCKKARIPHAIFTHCGSQIVKSESGVMEKQVAEYGAINNVDASIAYDGMEITIYSKSQ